MAESDWKYLQYNIETGQKRTGDGPSGGASSLSDLDDISISNPSDGQMLGYDETEGKWKNVNAPAGSVSDVQLDNESVVDQNGVAKLTTPNIDALGKTAISNPADGEMLGYDETEGKWKNVSAPGGNVDDVEVNGISVVNAQKVAKITSYKEVTQAQYEALPDTKLSDGVLYAIKDGGQAVDGFPPLIYSDEEREIGVWRDGKPLYQKTVFIENMVSDTNWHTVAHGVTDIDKVVDINGATYHYENGDFWVSYALNAYRPTGTMGINISVNYSSIEYMNNWVAGHNAYITFKYTKITDTPGSGTWTTQGALAHHYSTDEHIVGTWIDGKPLYEKTLDFSASFTNSGTVGYYANIALTDYITSIDKCWLQPNSYYLLDGSPRGFIFYHYSTSTGILNLFVDGNRGTKDCRVTFQYTKTTD